MHPNKATRERLHVLTDLPNVGASIAGDLRLLGIQEPQALRGRDALMLYRELCQRTGVRQDLCVLDVFLSIIDFVENGVSRPWWDYTPIRKQMLHHDAAETCRS